MTEKEKMINGELYNASDPELIAEREHTMKVCSDFNNGGSFDTFKSIFDLAI
ncbi:MAG: hypothetical protein LBT23_00420 [Synergistaceae bacterium]|jgi:maltose O-acetyltransferase|nr:hypothetical protein [Synergistaceae bacterium]